MIFFSVELPCTDAVFGPGNVGDIHKGDCDKGMVGYQTAECDSLGNWQIKDKNCIVQLIQSLKERAEVIRLHFKFYYQQQQRTSG